MALALTLLAGCVGGPPPRPETYVVQPDDTLYSIAWRFDLNFHDLATWNGLGAGYRLSAGQILLLRPPPVGAAPPAPSRAPAVTAVQRPMPRAPVPRVEKPKPLPDLPSRRGAESSAAIGEAQAGAAGVATPGVATPGVATPGVATPGVATPRAALPGAPAPAATAIPAQPLVWVWPTRALRRPVSVPGGGVLMLGGLGQDVLAAAAGRVVYVGSGIRGYGNLIIIKHSDTLLSAYAHNREVSVTESQLVKAGERIAAMGLGPRQIPALYFEVRVNGKPSDVFTFLKSK